MTALGLSERTIIVVNVSLACIRFLAGTLGLMGADILGGQDNALALAIYTSYVFIGAGTILALYGHTNRRMWGTGSLFAISVIAVLVDASTLLVQPLVAIIALVPIVTIRHIMRHYRVDGHQAIK